MLLSPDNAYFLPLRAGWDSSLEWSFYTEIQTLFNGGEECISLRPLPWERIKYKYTFPDSDSPKIKPFLSRNLRDNYMVPYYFLSTDVIQAFDSYEYDGKIIGSVIIETIRTGLSESGSYSDDVYKYGSWIVFYKKDKIIARKIYPQDGYVNDEGRVRILFETDGNDEDYSGWRVCPSRLGKIINNPTLETNKRYSYTTVEYFISDPIEFYETKNPEQYNGVDVYRKCFMLNGDTMGFTHTKDLNESSNTLGIRKYFSDWDSSFRSFDLKTITRTRSEFIAFLRWNMRRSGQYQPFWSPVYTTDFNFIEATLRGISVKDGDPSIKTFAIYRNDGSFYLATASRVTVRGNIVDYIFPSDFEEIPKKVYYAMVIRLSDDSVSFSFALGGKIVISEVSARSVN